MARPFHVVIDTCILVSALRSKRGAAHALMIELANRTFSASVTVALALEYEDVLNRPELLPGYTPPEIEAFIDSYLSIATHTKVRFKHRPCLPDPKDDMVLEAAVNSFSDAIITENVKDFRPASRFGIEVWTAGEFLKKLRSLP